jgi:hypothetical protein
MATAISVSPFEPTVRTSIWMEFIFLMTGSPDIPAGSYEKTLFSLSLTPTTFLSTSKDQPNLTLVREGSARDKKALYVEKLSQSYSSILTEETRRLIPLEEPRGKRLPH